MEMCEQPLATASVDVSLSLVQRGVIEIAVQTGAGTRAADVPFFQMGLCVLEIIVGKNTARDTAVKTVPRTKFWLNRLHNQAVKVFDCLKVCFYSGSDSIIVRCPC